MCALFGCILALAYLQVEDRVHVYNAARQLPAIRARVCLR